MASVFIAALFAHLAVPVGGPADPAPQDLRCYRLMAGLAEDEDPRIRSAGLTGAQYFLGRIDARAPGFDIGAAEGESIEEADRGALLGECSALMGAGGRDFRALGEELARTPGTI